MVIPGGWVFFMSEVPLFGTHDWVRDPRLVPVQGYLETTTPGDPYSSPVLLGLW